MRQLIKRILREEIEHEERLLGLIDQYVAMTYPNAIKVELSPPGGHIIMTSLINNAENVENGTSDEDDVLIHKMDAYNMPHIKFNREFLMSIKSMFGGKKNIKNILEKWFDNKPVDMDLLGSSKQEQNEGELTERCWKGYTQKGMKTMFGKRYPNCVKKKTIKEDNRPNKIMKMIDELGLYGTVKMVGGYESLLSHINPEDISESDKIKFIRDVVTSKGPEISGRESISIHDLGIKPIWYDEYKNRIRVITTMYGNGAKLNVYINETYDDSGIMLYTHMSEDAIDRVFKVMTDVVYKY